MPDNRDIAVLAKKVYELSTLAPAELDERKWEALLILTAVLSSATADGIARTNADKEARWGDAIRKEGLLSALHPKWHLRTDDGKPPVIKLALESALDNPNRDLRTRLQALQLIAPADREPLTDLPDVPGFNDIFEQLQALKLAVYTPLAYVFPSRRAKYEDLYNVTTGNARSNLGQAGREQGLKKLMTVNLLKRLESSVEAFRLTLAKIEGSVDHTLTRISNHAGNLTDLSPELAGLDFDVDDEDDANIEALSFGEKIRIDLNDLDIESWQRDLWNDREPNGLQFVRSA